MKVYVGTSIGLFTTGTLQGYATCWQQEGQQTIGNAVITMMDIRQEDGYMAIATHGAGVYTGSIHTLPERVAAPALIYPAQDTNSQSTLIRYKWQVAQGTVFSRLEVSEQPDFSQLTFSRSMIPAGIYTGSTGLKTGKRYYWRVFGINSAGDSEASGSRTFSIGTTSSTGEETLPSIKRLGENIFIENLDSPIEYKIVNVNGKAILGGTIYQRHSMIDIQALNSGIYLLYFLNNNNLTPYFFNVLE
jgi:hypothetical protein